MRLHILSDLHLSVAPLAIPDVDADVTILAGDISRPAQAIEWAKQLSRPVIYVAGNHEFYGATLAGTLAELRRLTAGTQVHLLERGAVVIDGVRFIGTTLWTDLALYDAEGKHDMVIEESKKFAKWYRQRAEEEGVAFFDAASVAQASPVDGVHLDAANTRAIGEGIAPLVRSLLGL